jgi:hypothetical protein
MSTLVVISYWSSRPPENLFNLVFQLSKYEQSYSYSLCIVCNVDSDKEISSITDSLNLNIKNILDNNISKPEYFTLLTRRNIGMNIGAWDYGWKANKQYKHYIFLQDEVVVLLNNWLSSYMNRLNYNEVNEQSIFLLGESWNMKWDIPWNNLINSGFNTFMNGHPNNVKRVDFYLQMMRKWNISPGSTGGHLRSLIWITNQLTLETIKGFHEGSTFGECIASEISATKAVIQNGGHVKQIFDTAFHVFWHPEWRRDGLSKI